MSQSVFNTNCHLFDHFGTDAAFRCTNLSTQFGTMTTCIWLCENLDDKATISIYVGWVQQWMTHLLAEEAHYVADHAHTMEDGSCIHYGCHRPYAHDIISVGRPHPEVKRRLFIGQSCAPHVQICMFQLFRHCFTSKNGIIQCIRSLKRHKHEWEVLEAKTKLFLYLGNLCAMGDYQMAYGLGDSQITPN